VAGEIADLGYSVPEDVEAAVDEAEQMMFNVAERRTADTMSPLHELLLKGLDRIEELGKRGSAITGVATGYHELDKILLGLQPSSLTIVGARPGMGKTSFALGILAHVGVVVQRPALLFSLEMGHLELTQRMLASEAEVNGQNLQTGQIRTQDWPKLGTAVTRLSNAPIFIDDNPNVTVMDIRARARRLKKSEGDLGLVVIDYLQLMTGRGRAENRQTEVAEISRGLKILARELEVPVVALSQLSRNLESRQDKTPMLSDLRESGSLEQDADVVLFLYRESEYNDEVADRPGRRRAGRRGQAPQRADRQGQPVVLEAVRPLRERPLPAARRRGQAPELLGDVALEPRRERVLVLQRGDLAGVAEDGLALALLVGLVRHDGRRRPGLGAQQLGHPPGQQPGDVLVAVVLVAEPGPVGLFGPHQQRRLVDHHVVGIAQAHGDEDGGRVELVDDRGQGGRHVGRRGAIGGGQVLVVGELEPAVVRLEHLERGQSSRRRAATTSSPALNPPRASHSEGTSG
jgi:replicative DNA helicase